eukprot:NODE_2978_length_834_cov_61.736306_g2473_i0.p1 GENE.NODE_2978_length_834_cov_61.736306_g2473_i0~~NODE_2978_length_834_cov_61.736306_g2473_i0.p1  ORF type:complete len:195 (-),score=52.30 NODE_2978_length_834_cov_61.736306_g2473_i0:79-663(-)
MEPFVSDTNKRFDFVNKTVGMNITGNFIQATRKGFEEALKHGPLLGNEVWGVRVVLEDGGMHEVDSSENSFKTCAAKTFNEYFEKAGGCLLQPVMNVEISVPSSALSNVLSSLQRRNGQVLGSETLEGNLGCIEAHVPLASMFGYTTELRAMTSGLGTFSMEYHEHMLLDDYETRTVCEENGRKVKSEATKKKK